ncbi:hypothetical protein cypCar_00046233 [Cyprinus carpio]|nr:hypothetical protein cypCar_00046233 [Cyprinus carpio]
MKSLFQSIPEPDLLSGNSSRDKERQGIKKRRMKKQSCMKRQQTGSSSHSKPKKKKQAKRQNCPKQKLHFSVRASGSRPPEFERLG